MLNTKVTKSDGSAVRVLMAIDLNTGAGVVFCDPPQVCPTCGHNAAQLTHHDARTTCPACPSECHP